MYEALKYTWYADTLRPTVMGSENRKQKQVFAFVVLQPTQGSGFFSSAPKPAPPAKKTCFSHTALEADNYGVAKQKTKQVFPSSY